uniref:Nucleotidyltransferase n=1 Tax=Pseudomonas phage HRDY3 TaxID=3236930 RepID=A0AB39CF19_9VIRU
MQFQNSPLTDEEKALVFIKVEQLGLRPVLISETGSMAWGTNTPESDHDFTVVAHDVDYNYFRWPRDSFSEQMPFGSAICDVRYFSVHKFLRKLARSELVAYESIYTPHVYFGEESKELRLYRSVIDRCFDPREMYRSVIGSLQSVKHVDPKKKRRQQFRYMFVGLQLIDYIQTGVKPVVNIEQYRELAAPKPYAPMIEQLYAWAMEPDQTELDNELSYGVKTTLMEFTYPKLVDFKQNEHTEFLSYVLGRLMGKATNWREQLEDHGE